MSLYLFISSIIIINTATVIAIVAYLESLGNKKSKSDYYYSGDQLIDDDDEYEVVNKYSWDK